MMSCRTYFMLPLGFSFVLALTQPALADGFKSRFQRRVVGDDIELRGPVNANFRPGAPALPPTVPNEPAPAEEGSKVDLSKEPTTKAEKLAVLEALIEQQRRNIQKMEKELADAKREGRNPDPKKLNAYATATGDRKQAYREKSRYVKNLIDRFEDEAPNTAHATLLALATLKGKLWQMHYKIEIDRSKRFIKMLEEEKRKLR